jgi:hypothetical protein
MIVLGVIIVGVAVSVGIAMFGNQAYNSNRSAMLSEMQYFTTLALQYWKLPTSLGGAGQRADNLDVGFLASFMGFSIPEDKVVAVNYSYFSDNGEYRVSLGDTETEIVIEGLGKELRNDKFPYVTMTMELTTAETTVDVSERGSWDE